MENLIGITIFWLQLSGSFIGNNKALVVKLDPGIYNMTLSVCACTAQQHMEQYENSIAAINAGMFAGYFLDGGLWLDDTMIYEQSKDNMKGRILFGDTVGLNMYPRRVSRGNYTKAFRMITNGATVWYEKDKFWSMSVIGQDYDGFIYLIHTRSPYTVNDFANQLQDKLGLQHLLYLEGGAESNLVTRQDISIGSFETDVSGDDDNEWQWVLPYAFVILKK